MFFLAGEGLRKNWGGEVEVIDEDENGEGFDEDKRCRRGKREDEGEGRSGEDLTDGEE